MIRTLKGFSFCDELWLEIGWWGETERRGKRKKEMNEKERDRRQF